MTSVEGSGSPIGCPNPKSTRDFESEVPSRFGYPRSIQGWGRQSATPTSPLRMPASSVGTGDLGGGVEIADWRP
ncbi:hypothetical protein CRG98_024323 [Punica granatum]|uniref:Uncharacterized protein n=1 Tax=Punica granatum TaxID=22663 RepID=A0A2I0JGA8_PUNGR|nr:hypothetical protein CRG98_024323 [Punica granatum]